jgi:outer membrane lipoprotein-sorting protein
MKLTILFMTFLITLSAHAITGREVMEKVKAHNEGYVGASATMTMTLVDAHDNKVERIMEALTKEGAKDDEEEGDKSITEFTKPLDVKGTKLLTWTMKKVPNKQWLYLPNFKRVKKINSKNQAGSFMGSEFSYEDIAGQEINKYSYKLISENADGWVVESTPKENSGYSKMMTTVSKKYTNPIEVKYYDRRGELLKTSKIEGYAPLKVKEKNIFYPKKVTMQNHQNNKKSIITWTERKVGIKHSNSKFKSQKLK